jgi:ribosomal protein S18 acetylase RimI-like enzyme
MQTEVVDLRFEEIVETDLPALTDVMTRAFDDDSQKHLGRERGGPPGYDNGDFFRKWLFGYEESEGYKALADGEIVGAMIVWVLEHGDNILGNIFVDPQCQDTGVGTRMWQFVETTYPETKSWTLETPCWAKKNHHFYENKCGFTKIKEEGDSFVYHKDMTG